MRHQAFTVLAALAWAANAPAADLGIRAGASFATFTGSEKSLGHTNPGYRPGLAAGLFLSLPVTDRVVIQPEVLYRQRGAEYEEGDDQIRFELDDLEVPVLLMLRSREKGLRPYLFMGGYVAFRLRARVKYDVGGSSRERDISEDTESIDCGAVGGIAVDIPAGEKKVVIDARYTLGLTTLDASEDPEDMKTSTFTASIGIRF